MGSESHSALDLQSLDYRVGTYPEPDVLPNLKAVELAVAGFILCFNGDDIKCVGCGFTVNCSQLQNTVKLTQQHQEQEPQCKYVTGQQKHQNNESSTTASLEDQIAGQTSEHSSAATSISNTQTPQCKGFHTFDSLRYERERLATFIDWPVQWLDPAVLAKEGFYYLREKDHCSCVFCRGIVGAWETGDKPAQEHLRHFPKCSFVRGLPVGNVPLAQGDLLASLPTDGPNPSTSSWLSAKKDRFSNGARRSCSTTSTANTLTTTSNSSGDASNNTVKQTMTGPIAGLPLYSGPERKEYITVDSRVRSFKNWPRRVKQTPQDLAEAGFFHCGLSDHVRCFHCGNGLRNWEADDVPWHEHARWYPACNFVLLSKGIDFIDEVRRKNPPYLRTKTSTSDVGPNSSSSTLLNKYASIAASTYTSTIAANYRVRIADHELDRLMELDIMKAVLQMGFPVSAVRNALKEKIEVTGVPFFTLEPCIESVLEYMEAIALEEEAERNQAGKMNKYQKEREQRIRQSHEESLTRPRSSSNDVSSSVADDQSTTGQDVVNTQRTTNEMHDRPVVDTVAERIPIVTSPTMPQRRISATPANESIIGPALRRSLSIGTNNATSNVTMHQNISLDFINPTVQAAIQSSTRPDEQIESTDIVEYPLVRRPNNSLTNNSITSSTSNTASERISYSTDITPTNDFMPGTSDGNLTSTPLGSPTPERSNTSYLSISSTSSDESHEEVTQLAQTAATTSSSIDNSPENSLDITVYPPINEELIDEVVIDEDTKRLLDRNPSNSSTKSTMSTTSVVSNASSSASDSTNRSLINRASSSGSGSDADSSATETEIDKNLMAENRATALADQLERLKESRMCKICMDAEMGVVFLPCSHMVTCPSCAVALSLCPICRTPITHAIRPIIIM